MVNLASTLAWPGVVWLGGTTVTEVAAELRRALAWRGGLPGLNNGHWLAQGVTRKAVMLLQ